MNQPEKLSFATKLTFGVGDLGPAMTANLLVFFLLFFFTNVAGLPPGLAGTILAVGKVSDAINDPIAGILSDRTKTRWGRRLPWIICGAIPFGILFSLQWIVPRFSDDVSTNNWGLFIYYCAIAILFNLAYTVVNLPYTALTPELTRDYNERTNLNSFRFAFSIGGSIFSLLLASLIFALIEDPLQQFRVLGICSSVVAAIALLWCGLGLQERGREPPLSPLWKKRLGSLLGLVGLSLVAVAAVTWSKGGFSLGLVGIELAIAGFMLRRIQPDPHIKQILIETDAEPISLKSQFQIAFRNRPFLYVIGIYLCSWLGVQLTASILIYFVVAWMGLPENAFPQVAIAVQGTALGMLFVWQKISQKWGKKLTFFVGTCFWIVAQMGLFFLQPGQTGLMYGLAIVAGTGVSVAYLIPWSMVPDVIELDELETGQRREGVFYGFMVLLQKLGLAIALFLVGILLDWAQFQTQLPGEPVPEQPASALLAIRYLVGPLPVVILMVGLAIAYFYPLTQQRHAEICQALVARKNNPAAETGKTPSDL
ncbi:MAG: MFS transporter [Cyanobacteria bacterium P01_H01_bin.15]